MLSLNQQQKRLHRIVAYRVEFLIWRIGWTGIKMSD
jgi:hypothetical protein